MDWADDPPAERCAQRGGHDASSVAIFEELDAAISRAVKVAGELVPAELGDAVVELSRLRHRLEALDATVVGRFDRSGEWAIDGYRHPTAWVKDRCRQSKNAAATRVRLARKVRDAPIAAEAFADGRVGAEHVERIAAANIADRVDAPGDAEEMLVGNAERLGHKDFMKTVAFFEQVTARDDAHPNPGEERRRCHSTRLLDGNGKVDAVLDPVGWSSFDECLRRIEQELFEADWAECVAEHGEQASADELTRTPAQRRADALVEMAHRAATAPKDGKRPEPLVILHADAETFTEHVKAECGAPADPPAGGTCELQDGTVVDPRVAVAAAVEGHVRRLVWRSPGVVLDYGRKQRLFTGVLRQLLQVRDRTCDGPGCDIDARRCEGDHLHGWTDGGRTDHRNGRCRCKWHHRHKHRFEITLDPVTGRTRWAPRRG